MKRILAVVTTTLIALAVLAAVVMAAYGGGRPAQTGPAGPRVRSYVPPRMMQAGSGPLPWNHDDRRPAFVVGGFEAAGEIYDLDPAKDAIVPLENPVFVPAAAADWLVDQAPVLGLKLGEQSHCYPLAILNWHSLVHDTLAGQAVHVFFDPPSGLAVARRMRAKARPMGLSGYGYRGVGLAYERSNARLYDFLSGKYLNATPQSDQAYGAGDTDWMPLERMTWREWRRLHGNTQVLSRETGLGANYDLDPYTAAALGPGGAAEDYWSSDTILAPEDLRDPAKRLRDKEWVLGLLLGGQPYHVALSALQADDELDFVTATGKVTVHSDPASDRYYAVDAEGHEPPQVRLFWFAWRAHFEATQGLE